MFKKITSIFLAMTSRKTTSLCFLFVLVPFFSFGQNALQTQIDQLAKNVKGNFGFCAIILETRATVSYNGDKQFPMQSVYKFPIAMAVLNKVDKQKLKLEQIVRVNNVDFIPMAGHSPIRDKFPEGTDLTIKELLRYNVAESDGTACDVLLRLLGGTPNANEYIHKLGVKDIAISTTEMIQVSNDSIQYKNWTTPNSMTKLLQIFYATDNLSDQSKALLLNDLIESTPGPKRLKGLLPSGTIVAHKTGTSGTFNGLTRATNDVGIIMLPNGEHLAISVLISDSYDSHSDRELTIAKAAKAAFDFWIKNKQQDKK
jgi:beta-lactamase class A